MKAALDLFRALGSANTDCRQDGSALGYGPREGWLFNTGLQGIEERGRHPAGRASIRAPRRRC